jgi:hypothetical protein
MAKTLHCSFCGKSEHEVKKLVAGPSAHICDGCVEICRVVIAGDTPGMARGFDPATWPTERLLTLVEPLNRTADGHREHLQSVVDQLRSREVSWAAIAEKLGVSRQAAWERFS